MFGYLFRNVTLDGCMAECSCGNTFMPVCAAGNLTFYSPCHAGCTLQYKNNASQVTWRVCHVR